MADLSNPTIPIGLADVRVLPEPTPAQPAEPLAVGAGEAAQLCRLGKATWDRLNAAERVPKPIKLGRRVLWSVADLRLWLSLGAPDRRAFEARKASAK